MGSLLEENSGPPSPPPEWSSSAPFGVSPDILLKRRPVRHAATTIRRHETLFASAFGRVHGNAPQVSSRQRDCRLWRLHRDLKEIREEPLHGIQVIASDEEDKDDTTNLCLILRPTEGCFAGLALHLTVTVPPCYPSSPPLVSIQTRVDHPNVMHGQSRICCQLLDSSWTPAYVLKYFFLQLLILFSQPARVAFPVMVRNFSPSVLVGFYSCRKCGFKETNKLGVVSGATGCSSSSSAVESKGASTSGDREFLADHQKALSSGAHLHLLTADVWVHIIALLSESELDIISLCNAFPNIVGRIAHERGIVLPMGQIACCFYLRKTFRESVLGLGVAIEHDRQFRIKSLDFLSEEAFSKHRVRQGVWGDRVEYFLPMALNPDHFCQALPIVLHNLTAMHNSKAGQRVSVFQSMPSFGIIPRLMNQMILDLGKVCHHSTSPIMGGTILRASEMALQGYCFLLHLLTILSNQFPQLQEEARRKLNRFMQDPSQRRKQITPNLGEFLSFLPLVIESDEKLKDLWPALCSGILEELLQRKATGHLKQTRYLANLQAKNYRSVFRTLRQTFESSKMALRTLMFQARFMKLVVKEREELAWSYGYLTEKMKEYVFQLTREIYSGSGWEHLLKILRSEEDQQCKNIVEGLGWASEVVVMLSRCAVEGQRKCYDIRSPGGGGGGYTQEGGDIQCSSWTEMLSKLYLDGIPESPSQD